MCEEVVIHLAASCRVDPDELASLGVLEHGFLDVVFVLQVGSLLHGLKEGGVLNGIIVHKLLDVVLKLEAGVLTVDLLVHHSVGRQACALDAVAKVGLLGGAVFGVQPLHPVLDLVQRLLLAVESFDAGQVEGVGDKSTLDAHVKWGITSKGRTQIDLQQPWLEVRVNQDVKPKDLEAVGPVGSVLLHGVLNVVLAAEHGLDDDIISPGPQQVHVDADLLEVSAEGSERPLVAVVVLLAVFVSDELLVLLVDGVVRQMHVLVVLVDLGGVGLTRESGQTLLEHVEAQWLVAGHQHVHSQVELVPVDQKRVGHISRDYGQLVNVHVVDVVDDVDALALG